MSISSLSWFSVSIKSKNSSLEYKAKGKFRVKSVETLSGNIEDLLIAGGCSSETADIMRAMIAQKMIPRYHDMFTSAIMGPHTKRINFVFPDMIVSASDTPMTIRREHVTAIGKKGSIDGVQFTSNFDIDIVINPLPADGIEELLEAKPEWFLGKLDLKNQIVESVNDNAGSTSRKGNSSEQIKI
ncbi:putative M protein [Cytorhabdovirus fragariarugosus]|uniref:Putative M protein n=1 Tax=Cytorhabdovirus fragariarugosus TaxID=1985706 RepID=A0A2U8J9E9_9RHAB|nr:putative M protein [Cytorhabdovirus fragariarugosus]AWK49430.1 putative M protein [Cytorhabdovirus fragariarugosus]